MHKTLLSAAVALLFAGPAFSQTIEITPDQERTVYTTIIKEKVRTAPPADLTFSVGTVIPPSVEIYEVPVGITFPTVRKYHYTVVEDRVVLIDPQSRTVVKVITK